MSQHDRSIWPDSGKAANVSQPCSQRNARTAHLACLPIQTHLIQVSLLVDTPRPEMDGSIKKEVQLVLLLCLQKLGWETLQ